MAQCTFGYSKKPCAAQGVWFFRDLEDFYCSRHAKAARALLARPWLADLTSGERSFASIGDAIFDDLSPEELGDAEQLIWETYPDAVAVKYACTIRTTVVWLQPDHEFLTQCEGELVFVERE
ncbi:MAG: hypothetical protein BMS9Abin34_452 [Patescibacteria group bacterium]|nr:MAG: hypothetical protein BMS9Abin34_452 [Patescibacteria group bacterium]